MTTESYNNTFSEPCKVGKGKDMKGFLRIKWWMLVIIIISCLIAGFATGSILKMESAFDLGRKIAIDDIRQGTRTAHQDGQPFFWLAGVPYRMNAISEKTVVIVFKEPAEDNFIIAGTGDDGVRRVYGDQ